MQIVRDENEMDVTTKPFDPTKQYRWNPDTEFILSGGDFAMLLNALRAYLSTENAQLALLADRASRALEEQLKSAVHDGRAVEVSPEEQK